MTVSDQYLGNPNLKKAHTLPILDLQENKLKKL